MMDKILNRVTLAAILGVVLLFTFTYLYVKKLQDEVSVLQTTINEQQAQIVLNELFINKNEAFKSANQKQTDRLLQEWDALSHEKTDDCDVPDSVKHLIDRLYDLEGRPDGAPQ